MCFSYRSWRTVHDYLKHFMQRIHSSPCLASENKLLQNMHSVSTSSSTSISESSSNIGSTSESDDFSLLYRPFLFLIFCDAASFCCLLKPFFYCYFLTQSLILVFSLSVLMYFFFLVLASLARADLCRSR